MSDRVFTLLIPVYGNGASLPALFEQHLALERELAGRNVGLQLIYVDDGSADDSFARLKEIKARRPATIVVKLSRNFGATAACKAGLRFVSGDACALGSADLQDPVDLVPAMVDRWLAGDRFVVAVREGRDDPASTRAFAGLFYWIVRRFIMPNYPRGGFDMALLDRPLWQALRDSGKNVNTSLMSFWLGYPPTLIPYRRGQRLHGRSMWTFSKKLVYFIDSLVVFSLLPLRLLSGIGLVTALVAFLYGLFIVVNALIGNMDLPGFATIVTLVAFLSGIQLAMLAAIGEYIWRIFDDINRRPEAVIDEVL